MSLSCTIFHPTLSFDVNLKTVVDTQQLVVAHSRWIRNTHRYRIPLSVCAEEAILCRRPTPANHHESQFIQYSVGLDESYPSVGNRW